MKPQPATESEFGAIFAAHSGAIYRFALRLSGNREDAEDLTAETFCEAFQGWDRFRKDSKPRTWLYRITLNRWRMRRRKKLVKQVPLPCAENVSENGAFDDVLLAEALSELTQPMRVAFLLVKGEGLTHAEAAAVLRVPTGTVYSRVHGAVQSLRKQLAETDDEVAVLARYQHEM